MRNEIDWEELMTKTERAATSASMQSERAVAGVAKVLVEQRRLSQELHGFQKRLRELSVQPSAVEAIASKPSQAAVIKKASSHGWGAGIVVLALLVCAAFVAYILS